MLSWSVVGAVVALGMTESRNRSTSIPLLFEIVLDVHGGKKRFVTISCEFFGE